MVCLVRGSQNSIFYFVEYNCFYLSRHPYMLLTAMYCDSAVLLRSSHFTIHKQTFRCILYFLWAVIRLLCFSEDNLNQRFRYRLMAKKAACWHENLQNLLGRTILYFVLDSQLTSTPRESFQNGGTSAQSPMGWLNLLSVWTGFPYQIMLT